MTESDDATASTVPSSEQPVERKVQLTGGSTYTVSIPKDWATAQDIEPGSLVDVYSRPDRLVIARGDQTVADRRRVTTVPVDGHDPADLARFTTAAYVAGCDEFRIDGPVETGQRRAVLDATTGLIGFETHFSEEPELVVRSMLDSSELSLEQTLAQMKITALSMHEDAVAAAVDGDGAENERVVGQDDSVDRLFGLLCRQFQRSLVDPGSTVYADGLTTFEYYTAGRQLERIADHAEKIATLAGRITEPPAEDIAESLLSFAERARELVERALAGLLDGDAPTELSDVVTDAEALLDEIADLDRTLYERDLADGYLFGTILDSIVRTVEYGVNIAEAGLQAAMRGTASSS